MNRFFWKGASSVAGTKATKTKILRNVAFPLVLDVYNYCNEDLKKSLKLGRDYENKQKMDEDEKILTGKKIEEEEKKEEGPVKKKEKVKLESINDKILYQPHGTGLDTGNYHLVGVVTHKGRSADSGHYVGWTHKSGDTWVQYDDDIVTT